MSAYIPNDAEIRTKARAEIKTNFFRRVLSFGACAVCAVLIISAFFLNPFYQKAPTLRASELIVQASDLKAAGYTVEKQELPTATMYKAPTVYFRVVDALDKAPTDNLVMVSEVPLPPGAKASLYNYGTTITPFLISNGANATISAQIGLVDNGQRAALDFIKDDVYVVIFGPASSHVEALAAIVASRL